MNNFLDKIKFTLPAILLFWVVDPNVGEFDFYIFWLAGVVFSVIILVALSGVITDFFDKKKQVVEQEQKREIKNQRQKMANVKFK